VHAPRLLSLACAALLGCTPAAWGIHPISSTHADPGATSVPSGPAVTTTTAPVGHLPVFINGSGAHIVAGDRDDASGFVSAAVKSVGLESADLPAFEGTQEEWQSMLSCTQRYFSGLPVTLVDQQPEGGDYLMVVVGGRAGNVVREDFWGWAPTMNDRSIVERGIGFVFSADHQVDGRSGRLCETLGHEIGHLLGLPHAPDCHDVMSDNSGCTWDGPRGGFLADNWASLASTLARRGNAAPAPVAALVTGIVGDEVPDPERMTGIVGESTTASGLYPEIYMPVSTPGVALAPWPVNLTGTKPLARARLVYLTPSKLRGEYECLPGGDCHIDNYRVESRFALSEPGMWWMLIEVHYTDGEIRRTRWFSTTRA